MCHLKHVRSIACGNYEQAKNLDTLIACIATILHLIINIRTVEFQHKSIGNHFTKENETGDPQKQLILMGFLFQNASTEQRLHNA